MTAPISQLSQEKIISHMVGREVKNLYPRPQTNMGETFLAVKDFSVEDPANPGRYVVKTFHLKCGKGKFWVSRG